MDGGTAQSCWLLLTLFLKGILAGDWSVHLPSGPICTVTGSSVVIPCSYDYPQEESRLSAQDGGGDRGREYKVLSEMWCLEDSRCITPRYVYHSDHIFPDPSYKNRVQYLGQPGSKNCSLRITDLTQSDSGTYVFYLITNHSTEKMPEQAGVQLLVADSSSAVTALVSPPRDITEGTTLRLACCSPVQPQARFSWYKNASISVKHTGQVWNITEVTSDVSGSYYCQIQTGDKVQTSTMLPVSVQYPPRNTAVSVSPAGQLDYELPMTLTCSSDANPPVQTYIWYQGAACPSAADKGRQTKATPTGNSQTSSSANITTEEYGQHCCVARNRHGSQTSSITLRDSRAVIPPLSAKSKAVLAGVIIGILLAVIAIAACFIRRRKSARRQSYVLTETAAKP
ncbi:sialoadhesin [Archocentrus centrarchus]|uniref:sialoadhesin n=1 Tax=Archocentrus centrarchus TaxID=63155 RepID=UPI0011E9CE6B|nr:sialoadhesin-like [Archocentrus centrarchus]